jgi:hypothetical protein
LTAIRRIVFQSFGPSWSDLFRYQSSFWRAYDPQTLSLWCYSQRFLDTKALQKTTNNSELQQRIFKNRVIFRVKDCKQNPQSIYNKVVMNFGVLPSQGRYMGSSPIRADTL